MRAAVLLAIATLASAPADAQAPPPGPDPRWTALERGVIHDPVATVSNPTQTFALYLPKSLPAEGRWPLLMVFDPRSRGKQAAEIFVAAADRWGWVIASSNNTLSDDNSDPERNSRAVNAMYPDLMTRLPVDPRRIYAGGFSGGAILSWVVGLRTGALAGVISVGGRPPDGAESELPSFALWAAAARVDFNFEPTRELDELARRAGKPHRFEVFEGPHSWFDADEASRAVAWMEALARRDGTLPRDPALAAELARADLAHAEARLAAGDRLAAEREFKAVAETYRGIADVTEAERRASALAADPEMRRARKDEAWGIAYEQNVRIRLGQVLFKLRREVGVPPLGQLRGILDVPDLLQKADGEGPRPDAGRRGIAIVYAQLAGYQRREQFAARDWPRAVTVLTLATELRPDDAAARYNLACALARGGRETEALESLARALELGIPQPEQMATDEDLAGLRERPEFQRLLERARNGGG